MPFLNRNLLWFIGLALLIAIGYYFSDILMYILLAWVFSMLGQPMMNFLLKKLHIGKWRLGPSSAAILTILSFYLSLVGLILLFVPTIVTQTRNLAGVDYQALGEKLKVPFGNLDQQLHRIGVLDTSESLATRLQDVLSTVFRPTLIGDVVQSFLSVAGNVALTLTAVTFILFFFLKDSTLFNNMLHAIVPDKLEEKTMRAVEDSSKMLSRYILGLFAQMAAFTTILSLILWALGVPNALLIGVFGGLLNVIPYLGPIIGMVFGLFITISSHLDMEFALMWPLLIKVAGAFAATQFVDNNFTGPAIFSKSLSTHPLEIFIVTLVAAKLGGIVGMVLGIPTYTVLRVIARVFFSEFKWVQQLTGQKE